MLEGAARALYVSAWASAWEYAVEDDRATGHPWSGGDELTEVAPDTPADITKEAEVLLRTTAMDNRVNLTEIADEAGIDDWDFGFALAMEAMGHGVGLQDEKTADGDYFEHDLKFPYVEPIVDLTDEEIAAEGYAPELDEEEDEVPDQDTLDNSAVIQDVRRGSGYDLFIDSKHIGTYEDWDEAVGDFRRIGKRSNYFPDLYYVNERGNVDLLDDKGEIIRSWV